MRATRLIPVFLFAGLASAQEAGAPFDAATLPLGWAADPFTALLDYDDDGDLDALGDWTDDEEGAFVRLQLYYNDGNGRLISRNWNERIDAVDVGESSFALDSQIAIGDINADLFDDVVFANRGFVRIYTGSQTGLSAGQEFSFVAPVRRVLILDVDGDGTPELAFLTRTEIRLYRKTPARWRLMERKWSSANGAAADFMSLELNGDGADDLAIVTKKDVKLFTWDAASEQLIGLAPSVERGSRVALGPLGFEHGLTKLAGVAGDVTGDGRDDVVIFGDEGYKVLSQPQTGVFELGELALGGPATNLFDVDGDGDLDGLCCGGGGPGDPFPDLRFESNFEISLNDGKGGFAPAFQIRGEGAMHLAGAGDLDADGDIDLVAGRAIYYGNPGFCAPSDAPSGLSSVTPYGMADYDVDGLVDAEFGLDAVMRNLGDGTFQSTQPSVDAPPAGTSFVGPGYPGDFTGDGHADLIVEHWQGASFVSMRLLENDGFGHLGDAGAATGPGVQIHPTLLIAKRVRVADVENDGDNDLITVARNSPIQGSTLWMNDGAGFFTMGHDLSSRVLATPHTLVAVADFNNDTFPDLLTNVQTTGPFGGDPSDHIRIVPGLGGGAFGAPYDPYVIQFGSPTEFGVNTNRDRVAVVDVDGDGDLDVIGFDTNAPCYGALLLDNVNGNLWPGFGSFGGWGNDCGGGYAATVDAPDLDDDGLFDLVIRPFEAGRDASIVYMNSGGSTFTWASSRQLITPVSFADVDGDGDPDGVSGTIARNEHVGACN